MQESSQAKYKHIDLILINNIPSTAFIHTLPLQRCKNAIVLASKNASCPAPCVRLAARKANKQAIMTPGKIVYHSNSISR